MSTSSSQNSGRAKTKRLTNSDYDMLDDFAEKPHSFPGTKINPENVPEEGLDLEGMENPFGQQWDII